MKTFRLFFLATILMVTYSLSAQVVITTDNTDPDGSAMLDVKSTDKGFLPPRMTEVQMQDIINPANGLIVFNITDGTYYAFVSTINTWREISYGQKAIVPFVHGQPFTDKRDGKEYETVVIGDQCWMAENLNVGTEIVGAGEQSNNYIIEKYCYDDNTSNCNTYGGLYQWDEMMGYLTDEGLQGICPVGWHLPTSVEWSTLITHLGGSEDAGGKMKEEGLTHWNTPNTGATNSSGFTALPGGRCWGQGGFDLLGKNGYFWSSSESSDGAEVYFLSNDDAKVGNGIATKHFGFSVRCLRDTPNQSSNIPNNPNPNNYSPHQPSNTSLSWSCSDPNGYPLTYDVYFGVDDPPTIKVSTGQQVKSYTPAAPLADGTTYYWKITAHDNHGNSFEGPVWNFTTFKCGGYLIDPRGEYYETVEIGTQCWMAENLNVGTRIVGADEPSNNNIIEKYCYDDNTSNCYTYGGLYQWGEMMGYVADEGVQGICPVGWHVPTSDQWVVLINYLGGSAVAGGKMKEAGTTHWNTPNTGATNSSGFTALPGGQRFGWSGLGEFGRFWASTESEPGGVSARLFIMDYNVEEIWGSDAPKYFGLSVRCLRD